MVRNGLGDREGSVRKVAAGMLGGWVDHAEGDLLEVRLDTLTRSGANEIDQFLSRFDILSSQVAEEALVSVFVTRPELLDAIEFDGSFYFRQECLAHCRQRRSGWK